MPTLEFKANLSSTRITYPSLMLENNWREKVPQVL